MQSPKVAAVCLSSQQSGWTDHFATIVSGLFEKNVEIVAFVSKVTAQSFKANGATKIAPWDYNKKRPFKSIINIYKIVKLINKSNFDVVILYGESPQHFILSTMLKIKFIANIADPKPHTGVNFADRFIFKISKIYYLLFSSYIFVASRDLYCQMIASFPILTKFSYIRNKIKEVRFSHLDQFSKIAQDKIKINYKKKWDFIYFGKVDQYKGIDVFLLALQKLKIYGYEPKILVVSKNFNLDYKGLNITIIDEYLSHEDLSNFISESVWAVFPYLNATGTHTIQISNGLGVPVIASSVGSFKDYVIEGLNGILVEPGNADNLTFILLNALKGKLQVYRGKKLSEWSNSFFSKEYSSDQIIDLINSIKYH